MASWRENDRNSRPLSLSPSVTSSSTRHWTRQRDHGDQFSQQSMIVKIGSLNDNRSLSILKYSPAPEKPQQHIYFMSFCVIKNNTGKLARTTARNILYTF